MTEMESVDHTNPHTGEPFDITYRRGVVLAADGGERGAGRPESSARPDGGSTDGGSTNGGYTDGGSTNGGYTDGGSTNGGEPRDADEEEMEDVEHEGPNDGANRSFERGTEGRDEAV